MLLELKGQMSFLTLLASEEARPARPGEVRLQLLVQGIARLLSHVAPSHVHRHVPQPAIAVAARRGGRARGATARRGREAARAAEEALQGGRCLREALEEAPGRTFQIA